MNKKEIKEIKQRVKEHDKLDLNELSTIELKSIIESYKELGYKFKIVEKPDDLKYILNSLIHCESLTYREIQRELRYYRTKGMITPLRKPREVIKLALFEIECRFAIK
jgi:hypothetical protein